LYWLSFEEPPDATGAAPLAEAAPETGPPAAEGQVSELTAVAHRGEATTDAAISPTPPAEEAVVYVDSVGRLTFANPAARALLHWSGGELALSDVLAGGSEDSAALLNAVARQELIGQAVTLVTGPSPERLEISGLPFRDRDGNIWGAALFFRRAAADSLAPMDTH
jgi:PAS domain-containing protein